MLVENDILISHTEVVRKNLEHAGETYKAYGLSGVFTYPAFRRQGYGTQVVAIATEYIDTSEADIGIVHTRPALKNFYSRNGWIPMEKTVTLVGSIQNPTVSDQFMLMRFLAEKGRTGRLSFENIPLYFGTNTW